jgi:hypothetical protein
MPRFSAREGAIQLSQQPLRKLYFQNEIHYGRVIFSGLTH